MEVSKQLKNISSSDDFAEDSAKLVESWKNLKLGTESIEPILLFIEENSQIDFGTPGPLVHYLEEFYKKGYEEKLVESIKRKPTIITLGMLNSVINGTKEQDKRKSFILVMEEAKLNPLIDKVALQQANHFLERLSKLK
jgi:hypothetical protein